MIILSNNAPDTFTPGNGITKVKGYLLLVLAFTAIMNTIVSRARSILRLKSNVCAEVHWIYSIPPCSANHWLMYVPRTASSLCMTLCILDIDISCMDVVFHSPPLSRSYLCRCHLCQPCKSYLIFMTTSDALADPRPTSSPSYPPSQEQKAR